MVLEKKLLLTNKPTDMGHFISPTSRVSGSNNSMKVVVFNCIKCNLLPYVKHIILEDQQGWNNNIVIELRDGYETNYSQLKGNKLARSRTR